LLTMSLGKKIAEGGGTGLQRALTDQVKVKEKADVLTRGKSTQTRDIKDLEEWTAGP